MKLSSKGRYALAAAVCLAESYASGEYIAVLSISERLGISKIYLEQVFSLLKRSGLVMALKGAQGGYLLSKSPSEITAYDLLAAVEGSLFEGTAATVKETAPTIERALFKVVFTPLDSIIEQTLQNITLDTLLTESQSDDALMFYI
jgi:Rrf2 family protein